MPCWLFKCQFFFLWMLADGDGVAFFHVATEDALAETILNVVLDGALQRTGTKLHVVALRSDELLRLVTDGEVVAQGLHAGEESAQLDIDDALDGFHVELVEGDNLVETVEELWGELLAQALLDDGAGMGFVKGFLYCVLLCWLLGFLGLIIGKDTCDSTPLISFFQAFRFITKSLI